MAEQRVKTRVQSKHDIEANWNNASFAPLAGEIIIYDKDADHDKQRVKVGDGETPLGDLPFIVDKEATDAILNTTIVGASVSGKVVTFTRANGTTFTITTQDTNDNNKVLNTKNNTTKAYITGTTSNATNTGNQIFNSNIYFDSATENSTTVNRVVADRFVGLATKATADAGGNTINTTYETKADAASKLATANNNLANVTANMNKEAHLTWGGKNHVASFGPIDAAMIPDLGANRLAFFPKEKVVLEYSRNGGSTWTTKNSDSLKKGLFGNGGEFYIGDHNSAGVDKSNYLCRVTITTTDTLYTILNKFAILVSTQGSSGSYCTIEARTKANQDSNTNTWTKFVDKASVEGWSGWNIINISGLTTHGNTTSHYSQIRLTFGVGTHASTSQHAGLIVMRIMGFGGVGWSTHSKMSKTGHLYSYDDDQNATFPAKVTATQFVGPLQGNAATATSATSATKATNDGNGNNIVNTYATKTALAIEAEPKHVLTGSLAERCSPVSLTLSELTANASNIALKVLPVQDTLDGNGYLWKLEPSSANALTIPPQDFFNRYWDSYTSTLSNDVNYAWLGTKGFELDTENVWHSKLACYPSTFQGTTSGTLEKTSNGDDTYFMYGMFYSSSANTVYLCRMGCFYSVSPGSRMSFYFDSDLGTLYIEGPDHGSSKLDKKQMYTHLPEDLYLFTIGYYSDDVVDYASTLELKTSCNIYDFNYTLLNLNGVPVNSSGILETAGTHLIRFPERGSVGGIVGITTGTAVSYELSYLHESGPETALQFVKECDTKNFTSEFNKMISSGRADPDSNTPGLLYFKYL